MDKGIIRTIEQYIYTVARQQPELISAYVFGSYTKNEQRDESDIDIALVIDNLLDNERFDTQVRLMMLASQIDTRIEPHPISKEDLI
jgi:predicted nucleotidyltransferase